MALRKLLTFIVLFAGLLLPAIASAQFTTVQGGTGTTSPSGILIGVTGNLHLQTLTVGTGLTLTGTTLTASGSGGTPGGLNTQIQYNNSGSFGGITGATTDGTLVSLNGAHLLNPTINGAGTGLATLTYPNTSSNATITFPTVTGTLATLAGSEALTNKSVNGVTLTAAGSSATFLNGAGAYSTPPGSVYTGTYPILVTGSVISTAFGTTTNWGIGNNGFLVTGATGIPFVAASSTLNLPNSALQNSSITVNGSSISLGGSATVTANTTNALTFNNSGSGAASGTTFNGGSAQTISYNTIGAQVAGTYVTSVAVASSNGFTGSSSGGATPTITLTTSVTSNVLKGNGTAIVGAANGTDYTLLSAQSCSAGSFVSALTASGASTCTAGNTGTVTAVTGTWPIVSSGGTTPAISYAGFGTTTNAGIGNNLILYTNNSGVVVGAASSTLFGTATPGFVWSYQNGAWGAYATSSSGGGAVSSVSNSDGTLTISPTTGSVIASLALTHANTWTGAQTIKVSGTSLFVATSTTPWAAVSGIFGGVFSNGSSNPPTSNPTFNAGDVGVFSGVGGEHGGSGANAFAVYGYSTAALTSTASQTFSGYFENVGGTGSNDSGGDYALYVNQKTAFSSAHPNYAVYSTGGDNYLGGNTGIGTTSPYAQLSLGGGNLVIGAATAGGTPGDLFLPKLGTAAGSFIAVDPTGKVIATSTPSGSNSAFSPAANYATTGALPSNTYNNGTAGVGATLTEVGTGALSVDGNSPAVGQRVLIKNEATAANNGLYLVTVAGSGIAAFLLTRDVAYNTNSTIIPGIVTYVISGATLADDFWAMTSASPITVGTTALNYTEVSGGGSSISSIGPAGQLQTGATQTLATSSDTNLGLTITASGNVQTFTTNWLGTLSTARGGLGGNFGASTGALSINSGTVSAGTLSIANGGTNAVSFTANTIPYINSAGTALVGGVSTTSLQFTFPASSNPTPTVAANCSISTNAPYQFHCGNSAAGTTVYDPRVSFTFGISTTTAWAGSTTAPTITIPTGLTWTQISCTIQPKGASLNAQYQYANSTAYTSVFPTMIPASTTPGVYVLSSNNTPTTNATSTITFGTPAGSPTSASCTLTGTVAGI